MTEPSSISDQQLLLAYARDGSDEAFGAIVERHARWVFAAAFRQLGDRQAAEDATQIVFVLLAQRSRNMPHHQKLSGWLFNTLGYTVKNLRRAARRRRIHEQIAAAERATSYEAAPGGDELEEHLDQAVAALPGSDRAAILLRYYQDRSFGEIALALGITESAARKRVSRGTERLREQFKHLGMNAEHVTLAAAAGQGLSHAPAALAESVSKIAVAAKAGGAIPASILTAAKGTAYLMAGAKLKTAAVIGIVCLLAIPAAVITVTVIRNAASPSVADSTQAEPAVTAAPASSTAPSVEASTSDNSWRARTVSSETVSHLPPEVKILPSKFTTWGGNRVVGGGPGLEKFVGINVSANLIASVAYRTPPGRIVFATTQPPEKYDFISTLSAGSSEALQREMKRTMGLAGHRETREIDVLMLDIQNPNAPGLQAPNGGRNSYVDLNNQDGHMSWDDQPISKAAELLEGFFKKPIIDQTGLTRHFHVDVKWTEPVLPDPEHKTLKDAMLDQLGVALIPTRAPVEMLVVEKAKN